MRNPRSAIYTGAKPTVQAMLCYAVLRRTESSNRERERECEREREREVRTSYGQVPVTRAPVNFHGDPPSSFHLPNTPLRRFSFPRLSSSRARTYNSVPPSLPPWPTIARGDLYVFLRKAAYFSSSFFPPLLLLLPFFFLSFSRGGFFLFFRYSATDRT